MNPGSMRCVCTQVHSEDLAAVLGIVMAHQAPALKSALVLRLLSALVLPDPEHYRAHLRRLAALEGALTSTWSSAAFESQRALV